MSDPMADIVAAALMWIDELEEPTLVAVVTSEGSTPGTPGAVMIVGRDRTVGTVGGGSVEHDMIRRAREGHTGVLRWDHADPDSDSLCSGVQTMILRRLSSIDTPGLRAALESTIHDGCGVLRVSPRLVTFEEGVVEPPALHGSPDDWTAVLPVGLVDTLYLAGGGHVSLAVSRVVSTLPFRIVVLDNRRGLPTMDTNTWAHQRLVLPWSSIANAVEPGPHSWVIIMTAAHAHDREVLERLLPLELRYLGMLGSRHKVGAVFRALVEAGADRDRLASVRAPVGLDIGSHTPAEIAIAIAGELVRERNRPRPAVTAGPATAPAPPR